MKKNLFAKQNLNTLSTGVNSEARRACGCRTCPSCGKVSTATIKASFLATTLIHPGGI